MVAKCEAGLLPNNGYTGILTVSVWHYHNYGFVVKCVISPAYMNTFHLTMWVLEVCVICCHGVNILQYLNVSTRAYVAVDWCNKKIHINLLIMLCIEVVVLAFTSRCGRRLTIGETYLVPPMRKHQYFTCRVCPCSPWEKPLCPCLDDYKHPDCPVWMIIHIQTM